MINRPIVRSPTLVIAAFQQGEAVNDLLCAARHELREATCVIATARLIALRTDLAWTLRLSPVSP